MAVLCLPGLAPVAGAAPLEPKACADYKTEYDGLVAGGAKADMTKGPEWAKANLAPQRLEKIERLIALEEQLSFRCDIKLTARPQTKEPPPEARKPGKAKAKNDDDIFSALGLSPIPAPKRKPSAPKQ